MPLLRLLAVDAATIPGDRHAVARLIETHQPDVAVVQGAPSLLRWRSACAAIAREAGLVVVGGGRTAGGTLVLSDLGVDVEASREVFVNGPVALRPPGLIVASLRRLGAPVVLAAGRVPATSEGRIGLEHLALEVDPSRPPRVVALQGAEIKADAVLAASMKPVAGGTLAELTLPDVA